MSDSVFHPVWDWLADVVISGIALIPMLLLAIWLFGGIGAGASIVFIAYGGAMLLGSFHEGIKRFIHRVIVRVLQNVALNAAPTLRQSNKTEPFLLGLKIMFGVGVLSFFLTLLAWFLKIYSGGKQLELNENIDLTIYFTFRVFLIALPFICAVIVYLGKIKPILPPASKVQTIGGQQGSMSGGTVNVANKQRPSRNP